MDLIAELEGLGVNTSEALSRFMNNKALYAREADVSSHFKAKDYDTAVASAHTLKGVTGNLSLTPLYAAYTDIVALLRGGQPEKAEAILEEILPTEEKIIACIEKNS